MAFPLDKSVWAAHWFAIAKKPFYFYIIKAINNLLVAITADLSRLLTFICYLKNNPIVYYQFFNQQLLVTIKLNFMKQIKTIIAIAIFSVISVMQVNAADTTTLNPALPVELKYAGTFKNQPLIQLNFSGSKDENVFNIVITDEAGVVFYNADLKGEVFSKQFLLNTDDLGSVVLKFEITGKKSGKTVSYRVNRQVTEQMDVVKYNTN